jgi:hypothetical protein
MGGSEDGDGKGAKIYGVTGMIDGPGSVSTLILVVVRSTKEGGGTLLVPEEDILVGLDVGVREEDKDSCKRKDCGWDKGACTDIDGDVLGSVNGKEDGGAAETRAEAARITRMTEAHMDV